jgi:ribose transport system permease protein
MSSATLRAAVEGRPWIWVFLAALGSWIAVTAAGGDPVEITEAALAFSAFVVIASLGQMLMMTGGGGGVDLSIPATMTLAGVLSMSLMDGEAARIAWAATAAVGSGLAVGVVNAALIRGLRIPPVIATLGSGLVVMAIAMALGRSEKATPPAALAEFVQGRIFHVPSVALIALALCVLVQAGLQRTPLGRALCASGQSEPAAELAGLPVGLSRIVASCLSGVLAALTGMLLAAYTGGSSLDLGSDYLMMTIAVVVIGGTRAAGGLPSVAGVAGAAVFMFLLVSLLNMFALGPGVRMIIAGLVIVLVVALTTASLDRR